MERDPLTMRVARNIEAIMKQVGTNASQVAKAAGLGPTSVYDILKGSSRSPRLETLTKIAQVLDVPVALLLEEKGDDDLKNEILALVSGMDPEERQRTLVTIRAWAEMAKRNSPPGSKE